MDYEKPIIQGIDLPATVNINSKFSIVITVVDSEMVVKLYAGEIYSGEGG